MPNTPIGRMQTGESEKKKEEEARIRNGKREEQERIEAEKKEEKKRAQEADDAKARKELTEGEQKYPAKGNHKEGREKEKLSAYRMFPGGGRGLGNGRRE